MEIQRPAASNSRLPIWPLPVFVVFSELSNYIFAAMLACRLHVIWYYLVLGNCLCYRCVREGVPMLGTAQKCFAVWVLLSVCGCGSPCCHCHSLIANTMDGRFTTPNQCRFQEIARPHNRTQIFFSHVFLKTTIYRYREETKQNKQSNSSF